MWKDGGEARKTSNNYQRLQKWNRLLTTVTIPFNPPKSSEVAVKVIDKAGMETMWVINTGKEK
jgi:hypothetical protein